MADVRQMKQVIERGEIYGVFLELLATEDRSWIDSEMHWVRSQVRRTSPNRALVGSQAEDVLHITQSRTRDAPGFPCLLLDRTY